MTNWRIYTTSSYLHIMLWVPIPRIKSNIKMQVKVGFSNYQCIQWSCYIKYTHKIVFCKSNSRFLDRDISNEGLYRRGISIGGNSVANEEAPIPYHISGRRVSIAVPNNMMPQCFNYDRNTNRLLRPRRTRRSSIGAVLAAPSKVNAEFTLTITNVTANLIFR